MSPSAAVWWLLALALFGVAVLTLAHTFVRHLEYHQRQDRHLIEWMREQEEFNAALYAMERLMWEMHGVSLPPHQTPVPDAFERAFREPK